MRARGGKREEIRKRVMAATPGDSAVCWVRVRRAEQRQLQRTGDWGAKELEAGDPEMGL